jgi:hypothetical protein
MGNEFKLKNYTTSVPASKSIAEVETLLVKFGASDIMKSYMSDGTTTALLFKIKETGYKLPINVEGVKMILTPKRTRHTTNYAVNLRERANRVAWRVLKDWLHAQLSIIASGQAEPEQVLLPYAFNGQKTMYELIKDKTLALPAPKE